jgi:peptide/nickel transport system ATP-binding protein
MACLGWPFDARLIRSVTLGLRQPRVHPPSGLRGHVAAQDHVAGAPALRHADHLRDRYGQHDLVDRLEVTLAVLGFTNINMPTVGTTLYWANKHSAMVVGVWWWMHDPGDPDRHDLHRPVPAGGLDERVHRSAQPAAADGGGRVPMTDTSSTGRDLKAYYLMDYFGIDPRGARRRRHHLTVRENEVYGIAGESSSGKTSFIKTWPRRSAAAARRSGSVTYQLRQPDRRRPRRSAAEEVEAIRWKHLSYIMQGSMSVLNPVRRIGRTFEDFAFRHMGCPGGGSGRVDRAPGQLNLNPAGAARLSARALRRHAPARDHRAGHRLPAGVHHRRRADDRARRGGAEGRAGDDPRRPAGDGQLGAVRHPRHVACTPAWPTASASCMPAGWSRRRRRAQLFAAPKHPYTAHLVASLPRIGDTTTKPALEGRPPNLADPPRAAASIRAARLPSTSAPPTCRRS